MIEEKNERININHIISLVLSIYVLIVIFVQLVFPVSLETKRLLNRIDNIICFYFLLEFFIGLFDSNDKKKFFKRNWIDLLSSIPFIEELRWARTFKLVKIFRVLRSIRSIKKIYNILYTKSFNNGFITILIFTILLMLSSSLLVLQFERGPEVNIKTANDALWWSFVTITTVGYGDFYPITTAGRFLAAILMVIGIGLFGAFTALVASYFTKSSQSEYNELKNEIRELKEIIQKKNLNQ